MSFTHKPHSFSLDGLIHVLKKDSLPPFFKVICLYINRDEDITPLSTSYDLYKINTDVSSIDTENSIKLQLLNDDYLNSIADLDRFVEDEDALNKNKHIRLRSKSSISNRQDLLNCLVNIKDLLKTENKLSSTIDINCTFSNDINNSNKLFRIEGTFFFKNYQVFIINQIDEPSLLTLDEIETFISKTSSAHNLINYEYMAHLLTFIQSYSQAF